MSEHVSLLVDLDNAKNCSAEAAAAIRDLEQRIALLRKALEMATKDSRYTADDWLVLAEGTRLVDELQEKEEMKDE